MPRPRLAVLAGLAICLGGTAGSEAAPAGRKPLRLRCGTFDPLLEPAPLPPGLGARDAESPSAAGGEHRVVQFWRPVEAGDAAAIGRLGGRVLGYLPEDALLVRLGPDGEDAMRRALAPRWLGRLEPGCRLEPELLRSPSASLVVSALTDLDPASVEAAVRARLAIAPATAAAAPALSIERLGTDAYGLGARLLLSRPGGFSAGDAAALAGLEAVVWVERQAEPRPVNDHTIWLGQSGDKAARTDYGVSATIWNHGILGTGQIAAALDTGLDADLCFFKYAAAGTAAVQFVAPPAVGLVDPGRKVIAYYAYPGSDPYRDSGHGTATMGTLVGDDYAVLSGPTAHGHDPGDGLAPNAQLVAQAPLNGMANSLTDLFAQAHDSGARVHSNSWISGGNSYSFGCVDVDAFVWDRQDFLAVFGAGNSGGAADNGAIASPAVAKNAIAVGGSSHGTVNDGEDLMDYSRGPAFDGRIKPDLVAPGGGVNTAGSDNLPGSDNCTRAAGFGGTSAATPAVAGLALLARQYYSDGFYPSGTRTPADGRVPSAALLKATLVNGAVALPGNDPATGSAVDPVPSFNQGWGRVLLDSALGFAGDPTAARAWDRWNEAGLATGESDTFTLAVGPGGALEVTLVWSDPPASPLASRALVHDLDLEVEAPGGELYRGNNFQAGESVTGGSPDRVNNVEGVRLAAPAPGAYRLRVVASDVPPSGASGLDARQGFALVATFPSCGSVLAAPDGLSASNRGLAGIELGWEAVPGARAYTVERSPGPCLDPPRPVSVVGESGGLSLSDRTPLGGFTYSYRVRASDGCGESPASACVELTSSAGCPLAPRFAGLESASVDGSTCGVRLTWSAGTAACPGGPTLSYNVYRSTAADFVPSAASLLVAGLAGSEAVDASAAAGVSHFYVVRAEDSTGGGGGPANGGNEDGNTIRRSATADGPPGAPGTWKDDGGDSAARLAPDPEWSLARDDNHTPAGSWSYRTGAPGASYAPGVCAALVGPPLALDPAAAPVLSYWVRYNVEQQWDGVVVEISDDGASWADLPPDGGYPGDFALSDDGNGNPVNECRYPRLHGAFSGPPGNVGLTAWARQSSDLSAWAGRTVRLRWRLSSDGGAEYQGLLLDDIEVSSVLLPGACAACLTPASAGNTLRALKELPADVRLRWSDLPDAVSVRLSGSGRRDRVGEEFGAEPSGGGAAGAIHAGALADGRTWFYGVRGRGNCGTLGP